MSSEEQMPNAGDWETAARREAAKTGLYILFASIAMFFAALTSALIIRSGSGGDWTGIPMPRILWLNTAFILASSYFLLKDDRQRGALFGWLFLAGQAIAWLQIISVRGPGSWFFWTFSVLHALHLLGGFVAFRYARFDLAKMYWHFITGLWVYMILLFLVWRT
jgi:cytochrome c oxidase subunit 3